MIKLKSLYKINRTKLNGKRFYAFTDGLSESLNKEGEEIGLFKAEQADSLTFIQKGDSWKYYDSGSYPGVNWINIDFNDSDWSTGYAEFGYGDGDETTVVNFGPDSDDKYISTYFRKVISVDNTYGLQSLRFKVLRDDGVLIYLNGDEVIRDNMPEGQIFSQTQATSAVSFSDEEEYYEWDIDADLIDEGENVIAVEVHQSSSSSSDISFDLELKAYYFGGVFADFCFKWCANAENISIRIDFGSS